MHSPFKMLQSFQIWFILCKIMLSERALMLFLMLFSARARTWAAVLSGTVHERGTIWINRSHAICVNKSKPQKHKSENPIYRLGANSPLNIIDESSHWSFLIGGSRRWKGLYLNEQSVPVFYGIDNLETLKSSTLHQPSYGACERCWRAYLNYFSGIFCVHVSLCLKITVFCEELAPPNVHRGAY